MATLGIDFGTSNTAAGIMAGDRPYLIEVEPGRKTLPTSVFFDYDRKVTTYGSVANAALIDGREGRFMRALKSVLGTPLMREKRQIAYERLTLIEVVARFLQMLRERAEAQTGQTYDRALSGRPVQFHSTDMARNAQAEADLREAYMVAGYKDVLFMFEPEAAALASGPLAKGDLGLIVDIGGGTSDFSVFAREGDKTNIIASHGVRVGGTDFDRAISIAEVMPLLGRGREVRNALGNGRHAAPNAIFNDLATWQKIPFVYTAENRSMAADFAKLGIDPIPFWRLKTVLEMELGHDIAFAVEAGKIKINSPDMTEAGIDLRVIEPQLWAQFSKARMGELLADHAAQIRACADETLKMANVTPDKVAKIVFVGGSSLLHVVENVMTAMFPDALPERAEAFTAVADGLAIAASKA
ncbi:Hsp70 family protein [Yoonia sediminilitoris]|uniref:Putative chaperone protein n=1 Tax=Yoonia sediminilitoris TaxID=1286148 RepID=A0A2T6KG13_9RHOB|nr:Hsp70 family protein [Yoonia sediminilitoris]PUB14234.1 putative chaperone protein [Yoonia sediminilitoris]RCW95165.1 putative chaperone protein [Yoonia sediminilitoris]